MSFLETRDVQIIPEDPQKAVETRNLKTTCHDKKYQEGIRHEVQGHERYNHSFHSACQSEDVMLPSCPQPFSQISPEWNSSQRSLSCSAQDHEHLSQEHRNRAVYSVGTACDQASLSHDQDRVPPRIEGPQEEDQRSGAHLGRVAHLGEGDSHRIGSHSGTRDQGGCDEADQQCQAGRAPANVPGSRYHHPPRGQEQDSCGRDAPAPQGLGDFQWDWGNGVAVRKTCGAHLHGDSADVSILCELGHSRSGVQGGSRDGITLAASSVCGMGQEDEPGGNCTHGRDSCDSRGSLWNDRECEGPGRDPDHAGHASQDARDAGRARPAQGEAPQGNKQPQIREQLPDGRRGAPVRVPRETGELCTESSGEAKLLTPQKTRALMQASEHIVPEAWASVCEDSRLFLLEVACSQDSILTQQAQEMGKSCERCSVWNGCDLTTGEGVHNVLRILETKRPKFVWISTECGPFSPIQNLNQRNPKQIEELHEKQHEARKQHVGGLIVAHVAIGLGLVVCWEWSRRCRAWKWDMMDEFRNRFSMSTSIIGGCQVGLFDPKLQKPLGKEWRIECSNELLSKKIHSPCSCTDPRKQHAICEGSLTRRSAFYTKEFARKVVYHMIHLEDQQSIGSVLRKDEVSSETDVLVKDVPKKAFEKCWCKQVHKWNKQLTCPTCLMEKMPEGQIWANNHEVRDMEDEPPLSSEDKQRILRSLSLVHSSTGHGSYQQLLNALRRRNVSNRVLKLAQEFRCSACEERKRPDPRRQANLEVQTSRWKSVQMDAAFWRHPQSKKQVQFVLLLDEASRFMVGRMVRTEGTRGIKAAEYVQIFEQLWRPYFGLPDVLRTDPEGALKSKEFLEHFQQQGTMVDKIPAEAHWNLSNVERGIEWVKELLTKQSMENEAMDYDQLLSHAICTWNHREIVRGFSPVQHALGRVPDADGRLFEERSHDMPLEMMCDPDSELAQSHKTRADAAKTFIDWQLKEKANRAYNSRHHVFKDVCPGDLVFYWRTTIPGAEKHAWNRGNYIGPARVLAVETRKEADGRFAPSSVVWLVKAGRLVKVAMEQIRRASAREQSLHELTMPVRLPWTVTELTSDLRQGVYDDHVGSGPSSAQRSSVETQEEPREHPTGKRRCTTKAPPRLETSREALDRSRSPARESRPLPTEEPWQEEIHCSFWSSEENVFWQQQTAAVEIEIEMPRHQRQWKRMVRDPKSYFVSALRRKSIEVSERRMTKEEHEQFKGAKQVEIDKFLAAEALKTLPKHLQPNRDQAMKMRWVLTWKKTEHPDGTTSQKPKARAVVLGYMDPQYAYRPTFAPTMTRHSRQLLLQWAANGKHQVRKGDVSSAFLQGRPFSRDMYLIPTEEICVALDVPPGSVVKMQKACYGLVEAPIEWFETMNSFLLEIGFEQMRSDPCMWRLMEDSQCIALISGHVDDFLFTGKDHPKWHAACEKIQKRFKWQEWEDAREGFTQCGVQVKEQSYGFSLDQIHYLQEVQDIAISRERRKETKEETTDQEKTELRGLLGALSWHTSQVGFRFSAYTSLMLSEVPQSTVQTLIDANALLQRARAAAKEPMKIFGFTEQEQPQVYCWTDASSQNRHDGYSTKGIFIGMSSVHLEQGSVDRVSPWFWQSGKIDRVCRSPGAAEARASTDGEDSLYLLRYQWSEILGFHADVHDTDSHVKHVRGVLITDSRNVHDKVDKPYITPKGAQKRVDLEMMTLKESQWFTGLVIRWVSAQAMLANSLTKRGEDMQMTKFIQMDQCWRIVDDPNMFSGRKRAQMGKTVLDS